MTSLTRVSTRHFQNRVRNLWDALETWLLKDIIRQMCVPVECTFRWWGPGEFEPCVLIEIFNRTQCYLAVAYHQATWFSGMLWAVTLTNGLQYLNIMTYKSKTQISYIYFWVLVSAWIGGTILVYILRSPMLLHVSGKYSAWILASLKGPLLSIWK